MRRNEGNNHFEVFQGGSRIYNGTIEQTAAIAFIEAGPGARILRDGFPSKVAELEPGEFVVRHDDSMHESNRCLKPGGPHGEFFCTRLRGHTGKHIAHDNDPSSETYGKPLEEWTSGSITIVPFTLEELRAIRGLRWILKRIATEDALIADPILRQVVREYLPGFRTVVAKVEDLAVEASDGKG